MRILLVAATKAEIEPVLEMEKPESLDVLITGAGMVATAFHMGQKLNQKAAYDLILNIGIAGTWDRDLALGTVVNVVEDSIYELGAEDGADWLSIEQLGFGESSFPSTYIDSDPLIANLPRCKGITVNRVHGREESIARINQLIPNAQIESMEGAAVFFAAHFTQTPVLQIRCLSNYVERRNRAAWDIPLAIKNLNDWVADFITSKIQ